MNYFQELLESYDRLKKRTFKLVYINEQVPQTGNSAFETLLSAWNGAGKKASEAIDLGINNQYAAYGFKTVKGQSTPVQARMIRKKDGGIIPGYNSPYLDLDSNISPEQKEKIATAIIGGQQPSQPSPEQQAQGTSEQPQTPEELAYQQAITKGSPEYLQQLQKPLEPELQRELFFRSYELKKLCKPVEKGGPVPDFCVELGLGGESRAGTLGIGSSQKSFEKKVAEGAAFARNAETRLIEKTESLSLEQRTQAVEGWKDLTQVLIDPNLVDCNKIFNNIRINVPSERGGRSTKIIFGPTNEGLEKSVVTSAGSLEKEAIKRIKKHCKKDFNSAKLTVAAGNKYSIRGTFFEKCTNFAFRIKSLQRLQQNCVSGDKKSCSNADARRKELASDIVSHIETVRANAITTQLSEDIVSTTEYTAVMDILKEHQEFDTPAVLQFLARENAYASQLVNSYFPNAVGVIDSSLNPKTGNRADRKVLYLDQKSAVSDMSKLGGSVTSVKISDYISKCSTDTTNPVCSELKDLMEDYKLNENSIIHLGDLGLKRVTDLESGVTAGSFSGARRLYDLFKRTPLAKIQNGDRIEEGYISKIDELQEVVPNSPRDKKMQEVEDNIDNVLSSFYSHMSGNVINVPSEKQKAFVDLNKPTQVVELLKKTLRERVSNDILQNSSLGKLLKPNNFKGQESREESAGLLMRYVRHHMYRKQLKENPEATTDALLRRLYICGGNKTELVQSIVDDTGQNLSFNHNQVFRNLEQAKKENRIRLEVKDSSVKYFVTEPSGQEVLYAELGEDVKILGTGQSTHKFAAEFSTGAARSAIVLNEGKEASSIDKEKLIEEFIKIQQKLLECFSSK